MNIGCHRSRNFIRRTLTRSLPMILVLVVLFLLPDTSKTSTPLYLWAQSDVFEKLRRDCLDHPQEHASIDELKANFLANKKINDSFLLDEFRDSGLSHLLALSGGQTHPAAMFCSQIFLAMILFFLHRTIKINFTDYLRTVRIFTGLMQTSILLFLVGLYQSSGALNRALSQHVTYCSSRTAVLISDSTARHESSLVNAWLSPTPWIIGFVLHQNPVRDLSFLLSALGAVCSALNYTLISQAMRSQESEASFKKAKASHPNLFRFIQFTQTICLWILTVSATSAVMCLLTWPMWTPNNIFQKIQANILAGPCVMMIITPASLGVCLGVITHLPVIAAFSHNLLEVGLTLLIAIAELFSHSHPMDVLPAGQAAKIHIGGQFTPQSVLLLEYLLLFMLLAFLKQINRRRLDGLGR